MFQAIQAALLPKLARLAARGQFADFRQGFRRLMTVVGAVGVVSVLAAATIGPFVLDIVFNAHVGRRTLTLLALGSAMYMIGLGTAQAVIALHGHAWVAVGWIAGLASFIIMTALVSHDLLLRVELGLVAGSFVAMLTFANALRWKLHDGAAVDSASILDAITDHPLETP
jgi:O-antigen/teichoic acid export membrane protein